MRECARGCAIRIIVVVVFDKTKKIYLLKNDIWKSYDTIIKN